MMSKNSIVMALLAGEIKDKIERLRDLAVKQEEDDNSLARRYLDLADFIPGSEPDGTKIFTPIGWVKWARKELGYKETGGSGFKYGQELEDKMLALFDPRPEILHSEPAEAAARVLAYYWSGMEPTGRTTDKMAKDVIEVHYLLMEWVKRLAEELDE